jgi:hypothetical protein
MPGLEADQLLKADPGVLPDRIHSAAWRGQRRLLCFAICVVKGYLFEGWPGWFYILQRVLAEYILIYRSFRRAPLPEPDNRGGLG